MQTTVTEKRTCRSCGAVLRGRIDKKYCNDYCRNHYNNQQKQHDSQHPLVRQLNGYLLRNRRILQSFLPAGAAMTRVHRDRLLARGFLFPFHTHRHTTRQGKNYLYCYDHGYLELENGWFLLVKERESPESPTFRAS